MHMALGEAGSHLEPRPKFFRWRQVSGKLMLPPTHGLLHGEALLLVAHTPEKPQPLLLAIHRFWLRKVVSKIYLLWNIWYLLGQSITVFIILEFNFCILSENSHKMKWRVSSFQGPIYYCMFGTVKEGWIDRSKHLLKGDYLSHLIFTITWWGNWRSERLTDFPKVFHLITAVQVCSFYFHLNFPTAIQPIIKSYIQIF